MYQFSKKICFGLNLTLVFGALILGQTDFCRAADIEVKPGETVTLTGWNSTSNLTVGAGGTLIVPGNSGLRIENVEGATFDNAGTIYIEGLFEVGTSQDGQDFINPKNTGIIEVINTNDKDAFYMPSIPSSFFKKIMDNKGKIVLGGSEATFNSRLQIFRNNPEGIKLDSSQFVNSLKDSDKNSGNIVLREYGRFRASDNKLIITGDTLSLGSDSYSTVHSTSQDFDITDSKLSGVYGSDITLTPKNGNTITVDSGFIRVGSGRPSGSDNNTKAAQLIISDGDGSLQLSGGALVLGGGGNENADEGSLNIKGNVIIGTDSDTIDSAMIGRTGHWTMDGDLTLNKSGYLEIGQPYINGDDETMDLSTLTITVGHQFILNTDLALDENQLKVLGDMVASSDSEIRVTNGGVLNVNNIRMNGGQITFDPPFIADGDTSNASMGGLNFDSNNVDGRINVGRNSMVTLGSTDYEWLRTKIVDYQTKNNQLWGRDITAALAIRTPQTLAVNGGINVDGAWVNGGDSAAANTARFADKSLFVIDAPGVKNQTVLDGNGTGTLKVEKGAKVLITDAAIGDEIKVTDNFASSEVDPEGWTANATTSTDLQYAEGELISASRGEYRFRITDGKKPAEAFPMLSSELDAVVAQAKIQGLDTNSANPGVKFISRAVDNRYIGAKDTTQAAATIESAARIATLGAAPQMTMAANNAAGTAITQRTSLAQPNGVLMAVDESGNYIMESQKRFARNFALWIMPLYQSTNGFGMEAGNFSYDFNGALGGVALGGDYTFEDTFRIGLAFNIGGGYAHGTGDLNKTTNNMNFWGVGAYAGWTQNNFGLTADVNYTSTYNKMKQNLPESMQMGDLKSDIRGNAISAGLRAEYKIPTDYVDIVPHVGFRYTNLFFDSYNAKSGGKVLHGDKFDQNIWTFPIGVSFSKKYEMANNWHVKPLLDLNVTPAAGDIKAKTKVRFNGIDEKAEIDTKMMDYITYGGTAGFEIGNDTVTLGVDYNGQFGAESSAHGVYGTLRVEF